MTEQYMDQAARTGKAKKRAGDKASIIYDRLRTEIMNGTLPAGTPLSQLAIAREGGTSRGPVREALRRLQQDQLVTARANQQFNVATLDIGDLEAALSLHLAIHTLGMRVSVPALTDEDLAELTAYAEKMEATSPTDQEAWEVLFRGFILTILRHAGARTLQLAIQLIDDIRRFRLNMPNNAPPLVWNTGGVAFPRIAAAARARDGKRAASLYASFMGRLSSLILASAQPRYDAFRLRGYIETLVPDESDQT